MVDRFHFISHRSAFGIFLNQFVKSVYFINRFDKPVKKINGFMKSVYLKKTYSTLFLIKHYSLSNINRRKWYYTMITDMQIIVREVRADTGNYSHVRDHRSIILCGRFIKSVIFKKPILSLWLNCTLFLRKWYFFSKIIFFSSIKKI